MTTTNDSMAWLQNEYTVYIVSRFSSAPFFFFHKKFIIQICMQFLFFFRSVLPFVWSCCAVVRVSTTAQTNVTPILWMNRWCAVWIAALDWFILSGCPLLRHSSHFSYFPRFNELFCREPMREVRYWVSGIINRIHVPFCNSFILILNRAPIFIIPRMCLFIFALTI